jgi:acetyl esterase/lipase
MFGGMQGHDVSRRAHAGAALLLFALALSACGESEPSATSDSAVAPPLGPLPSDLVGDLRTDPDIVYTEGTECGGVPCPVPGDVLAPKAGTELPTIVLLGGGSTPFGERRYQAPLAAELARRGAVVFLLSYRSAVTGSYDTETAADIRCAVAYARERTDEYGGDPNRVALVGHSQSGLVALEIALQPEEDVVDCLADAVGKPDAVIGLGAPSPRGRDVDDSAPPIWLFAGSEDGDADGAAQRLRAQGFEAESRELPGVTHEGITDPAASPDIVDLIMEAISSL